MITLYIQSGVVSELSFQITSHVADPVLEGVGVAEVFVGEVFVAGVDVDGVDVDELDR